MIEDRQELLLPEGARVVHIGPSKTGTTSLQAAMWSARHELRRQGVHYAGRGRHSGAAARAVADRPSPHSDDRRTPPIRHWNAIVREAERAGDARVLFSSEYLAHARPRAIRRVAADLGPERVHIVVTLRSLPRLLASRWQQAIQAGGVLAFERWLETTLGRSGEPPDHKLWIAHRHDRLVDAWAGIVGADRLTVVVVDEADHAFLLRAFEGLLGIVPGTLALLDDYRNRSLRLAEVEAIRALNLQARRLDLGPWARNALVREGAARAMKLRAPGDDEPRVVAPRWAVERAGAIAALVVDGIRASGVRVIGSLDDLLAAPGSAEVVDAPTEASSLPLDAAVAMALGTARGSGAVPQLENPAGGAGARELDRPRILPLLDDRQVLRMLVRRRWLRAERRLRAAVGMGGADG